MLGNFSSAISGALAYAFDGVSGKGGLSGWQWLFLVEGLFTICYGVLLFFVLPDCELQPSPTYLTCLYNSSPQHSQVAFGKGKGFCASQVACQCAASIRSELQSQRDCRSFARQEDLAFHSDLGLPYHRDHRFNLLSTNRHCQSAFHVSLACLSTSKAPVLICGNLLTTLFQSTLSKSQLLNIPVAVLTVIVIAVFGIWADTGRLPRPLYPLCFAITIVACYGVLYSFPNTGGVYAATCIASAVAASWYPLMWPWRVQTTKHATGSAFVIGFVNSYGQMGGAISPWLFQSKYAPKYAVSFGTAMGMELACVVMIAVTWWATWDVEKATRVIKKARVAAATKGDAVLDDVEVEDKK